MRRVLLLSLFAGLLSLVAAGPALACGGLVAADGNVNLVRTTTLAGYHDGVEHYVTSFEFAGGGGEFGSIVPLPGVPTDVQRGGDWTLQRLLREVAPPLRLDGAEAALSATADGSAKVLLETRIDALDLTVLEGGATAVGTWAKDHGFFLPPDAPEVLEFYARRSPIFLAARFDGAAAEEQGLDLGDGTPIHLTIPTPNPWVPLRILALGRQAAEPVEADVFLLTDDRPRLLHGDGVAVSRQEPASRPLLDDLRSDKGMEWVAEEMVLSHLTVDSEAADLTYDLAIDADGQEAPSRLAAGFLPDLSPLPVDDGGSMPWIVILLPGAAAGAVTVATITGRRLVPVRATRS